MMMQDNLEMTIDEYLNFYVFSKRTFFDVCDIDWYVRDEYQRLTMDKIKEMADAGDTTLSYTVKEKAVFNDEYGRVVIRLRCNFRTIFEGGKIYEI